jgi:pimeloyl-ACP methyl ester carboxylesterase
MGSMIHYEVAGRGPLLVVQAPAWGIGSTYLRNGLARLTHDFTVLTFDPPGSGDSGLPASLSALSESEMVDTLEAMRQSLELPSMNLLGHSQGSAIAIGYAERYPDRVNRLVLIGSQVFGLYGDETAKQLRAARGSQPTIKAAMAHMEEPSPDTDEEFTRHFFQIAAYYFYDPDKDLGAFRATVTRPLSAWPEHAAKAGPAAEEIEEQKLFGRIRARTLIIEGREDVACPVNVSEAIQRGVPGSKLTIYEHTGHFPWIEQPKQFFADTTRFLRQ